MKALATMLSYKRLILLAAGLLAALGLVSWSTMPRQEDPRLSNRWGMVLVTFPGADAEMTERLVLRPLEERLAEVPRLKRVISTSRAGHALINLELADAVSDTRPVWDDVRAALRKAATKFPRGVSRPVLDEDQIEQEGVVLAVTGSSDPLVLADQAKQIKRRLLALTDVSQVKLIGDPGEQVVIEYDDAVARRHGVSARDLARLIESRSQVVPGGSLNLGSRSAMLRPQTDFGSVEEIAATPVPLPSGAAVPLRQIARVRRAPSRPAAPRMRLDGARAVGLGIVARPGINLVDFGQRVRAELTRLRAAHPGVHLSEVTFQPDRVRQRVGGLQGSLLTGLAMLAALLVGIMGLRLGLVVTAVVPLVALTALAFFALGGGTLHQISISALVIALGMLVDNAIVMAESVQRRMDGGATRARAAMGAVRELAFPLATATATTVAAFVPMLLSKGATGEFTRALPVVLILTLVISFIYAITVTPVLATLVQRPARARTAGAGAFDGISAWLARIAVRRHLRVLGATALLLAVSLGLTTQVRNRFFPASDRDQVMVDLRLPEGVDLARIDRLSAVVERELLARQDVRAVATFVGRSAPRFYYNINQWPRSNHRAQLLVTTRDNAAVTPVLAATRSMVARFPELEVVARPMEQGPAVGAPVEVRLSGDSLDALQRAAEAVTRELKQIPGAVDVRTSQGLGAPSLRFRIDDAAAARRGIHRADVALALLGRTRGITAGHLRSGDDPVPMVVRSSAGERLPVEQLAAVDVAGRAGAVPLGQLANARVQWRPSVIHHRDHRRVVTVAAQLGPQKTYDQVVSPLRQRLSRLTLPAGVSLQYGGEAEGSREANSSLLRALPVGALLLVLSLMVQFNSFRRLGIVLATVPLSLIGVIPGLLLTDQPFGFMSTLGLTALVGVVVNNAIVLLDVVERERKAGATVDAALATAIAQRTRPILLTSLTTVFGLLPLALSSTTLWPPLAWTMIFGLAASTMLSLVVVPALYRLLFPAPRSEAPAPSILAAEVR